MVPLSRTESLSVETAGSGDPVVIRNAYRVHVAILSPAHAGLITENLSASGHLKLSIARNTVLAISTGP